MKLYYHEIYLKNTTIYNIKNIVISDCELTY